MVLSHGTGGSTDDFAWLSSQLAVRGAMVVAVNHPGSTRGDLSPQRTKLTDRAADLKATLTHILADPLFGPTSTARGLYLWDSHWVVRRRATLPECGWIAAFIKTIARPLVTLRWMVFFWPRAALI